MPAPDAATVFQMNLRLSVEVLLEAAPEIESLGLEPKAFFVLDGLERQPYPAELARHLSMPRPTITAYLKTLEAKGLIARRHDPKDLRRHRLALTTTGRQTLAGARDALAIRYGDRLNRLSAEEQAEFVALLGKLTTPT